MTETKVSQVVDEGDYWCTEEVRKQALEIRGIERGHIIKRKGRGEEKKGDKRMNERTKNRGSG